MFSTLAPQLNMNIEQGNGITRSTKLSKATVQLSIRMKYGLQTLFVVVWM